MLDSFWAATKIMSIETDRAFVQTQETDVDFVAISGTDQSFAASITKVESHISDRFCAILWCSVNTVDKWGGRGTHWGGSKYSRVRTGNERTKPSRPTMLLGRCERLLSLRRAVAVHTRDLKIRRRRRQRESQKSNELNNQKTILHGQHTFLYISLPSLHDFDLKMPNFTSHRGSTQAPTKFPPSFWTWIWFLGIQL